MKTKIFNLTLILLDLALVIAILWQARIQIGADSALNPHSAEPVVTSSEGQVAESSDYLPDQEVKICSLSSIKCDNEIEAWVTAYTSRVQETDNSPYIGAGGDLRGKRYILACPRKYHLKSQFLIDGEVWTCLDRMALKNDGKFDLYFGDDLKGAKNWGIQLKEIIIL